jgi:hypothetical protein
MTMDTSDRILPVFWEKIAKNLGIAFRFMQEHARWLATVSLQW